MKKLIILILLLPLLVIGQTKELDTPDLPYYITDTIFIDPSQPIQGDGSYENPLNSLSVNNPFPEWDAGANRMVRDNTAYLFKRGVVDGSFEAPTYHLRFDGDNNFFDSYGQGAMHERITAATGNNRAFYVIGKNNKVRNLRLTQTDPFTNNNVLQIQGVNNSAENLTVVDIDSVVVSGGTNGIIAANAEKVFIRNAEIFNILVDGIFVAGGLPPNVITDTVIIEDVHVYDVNLNYLNIPGNSSGGDNIQVGTNYFELRRSILDHSFMGWKFNFISNFGHGIIDSVIFISHPHRVHAVRGAAKISNSVFIGGSINLNTWGESSVKNSIFIGYGKDVTHEFYDGTETLRATDNPHIHFYNNTFVNIPIASINHARTVNMRNNIFYNVGFPAQYITGSGNIHWNSDESTPDDLPTKYRDPIDGSAGYTDGYIVANPLLIDPESVTFTYRDSIFPGFEVENHWWYEVSGFDMNNFRVQENSPAINAGDDRVADDEAEFMRFDLWFQSHEPEYYNGYIPFTSRTKVNTDISATPRPQGIGFDIGAFEWYDGQPEEPEEPAITHTLIANTVGSGTITLSPDKVTYNENEVVQLTATPAIDWEFSNWSGDVSGTTNPVNLTMNSNKTITATFTEINNEGGVVDLTGYKTTSVTPLTSVIPTDSLINSYNSYWDSLYTNLNILRTGIETFTTSTITWNTNTIVPINYDMRGSEIRNTINSNNIILFENMTNVLNSTLSILGVGSIAGYDDTFRYIVISPSQAQFIQIYNQNFQVLNNNINLLYTNLDSYGN